MSKNRINLKNLFTSFGTKVILSANYSRKLPVFYPEFDPDEAANELILAFYDSSCLFL